MRLRHRPNYGRALVATLSCACALASPAATQLQPVLALDVRSPEFSPNGDGRQDRLRAQLSLSEPAAVSAEVQASDGKAVKELLTGAALPPGVKRLRWNGITREGLVAPDGAYTLFAHAVLANGRWADTRERVVLSTHPPSISWPFAPATVVKPTRAWLPVRIGTDAAAGTASLLVTDQAADLVAAVPVRWSPGSRVLAGAAWGERLLELEPAVYRVRVHAADRAGNAVTSASRVVVVQHPVANRVVNRFRNVGRRVALTFDDCTSAPAWATILRTLERRHVAAAFFCPGTTVAANRSLALQTLRDHDVIGDHSWDHRHLDRLSPAELRSEFVRDRALWWTLALTTAQPYFRPPYGVRAPRVLAAAGDAGYALTVLWDVDPQDWRQPGAHAIVQRVLSQVQPGSIVLLHVTPQTAAALPSILAGLRKRELFPTALDRLARLEGVLP